MDPLWHSLSAASAAKHKPRFSPARGPERLHLRSKIQVSTFQNGPNISQLSLCSTETIEKVKISPTPVCLKYLAKTTLGAKAQPYKKKRRSDSRSEGCLWMLSPTRYASLWAYWNTKWTQHIQITRLTFQAAFIITPMNSHYLPSKNFTSLWHCYLK